MDSPARYSIRVQDLTDEAFTPYGNIIKPRVSGEQFDRAYFYDPSKECTHVNLVMTNGEPTLRIMHQRLRGFAVSKIAPHHRVSQCLGSLQGKEWFMAVAAPTNGDLQPRLEDITAFRMERPYRCRKHREPDCRDDGSKRRMLGVARGQMLAPSVHL